MGLSEALISTKSLRHFADCAATGSNRTLTLGTFSTALGLCAIYVHREQRDTWSLREKVLVLLNTMGGHEPTLGAVRVPSTLIGPRVEAFLYSLFENFASNGKRNGGTNRATKSLTNWGWAKLLRELHVSESGLTSSVHPDVIYTKYATKGKLFFDPFIEAMTEFDRLQAERSTSTRRKVRPSSSSSASMPASLTPATRIDQENAPPPSTHSRSSRSRP